jgi:endonuclease-3
MTNEASQKRSRGAHQEAKPQVTPPNQTDQRLAAILERLSPLYAHRGTALHFATPLQLLVAAILSAQCTDERVNMVTPQLFARYPDARALAEANRGELEAIIRPTGFYRNKAKHIQEACRVLIEEFNGEVPQTMAELLRLPGVSRKTANVVLSHAFGKAEGIVVDTHVFRVARRLGLSNAKTPEGVERDLMAMASPERWIEIGDTFIWHGRYICQARAPRCTECVVCDLCPTGTAILASK